MIPRFGAPAKPGISYRSRQGVYGILLLGGRLLLTRQAAPVPEYQLPGGGVDPGESPLAALHREVLEETGWRIAAPRRLGAFRRFTYMPEYGFWAEKICTVYTARPCFRRCAPTENGHRAVWTDPDRAARILANPGDRAFVSSIGDRPDRALRPRQPP